MRTLTLAIGTKIDLNLLSRGDLVALVQACADELAERDDITVEQALAVLVELARAGG